MGLDEAGLADGLTVRCTGQPASAIISSSPVKGVGTIDDWAGRGGRLAKLIQCKVQTEPSGP